MSEKPHPIRFGILKKYLRRIAANNPKCKGLTDLVRSKMEDVVIADPECGPEYVKEILKAKITRQINKQEQEFMDLDVSKTPELKGLPGM